jgi:hypothetical protein
MSELEKIKEECQKKIDDLQKNCKHEVLTNAPVLGHNWGHKDCVRCGLSVVNPFKRI